MNKALTKEQLKALKVGSKLIRSLAGTINQPVIVSHIHGAIITVSTLPEDDDQVKQEIRKAASHLGMPIEDDATIERPTWIFSANTGCEIDIDLGWDGITTGSYLIANRPT